MGSLENFHQETIRRLQSGELQLGVSKMAGADRRSVAFSKLFTLFPYLCRRKLLRHLVALGLLVVVVRHRCACRIPCRHTHPPQSRDGEGKPTGQGRFVCVRSALDRRCPIAQAARIGSPRPRRGVRVSRRRLQEIHGAALPSHLIPNPSIGVRTTGAGAYLTPRRHSPPSRSPSPRSPARRHPRHRRRLDRPRATTGHQGRSHAHTRPLSPTGESEVGHARSPRLVTN